MSNETINLPQNARPKPLAVWVSSLLLVLILGAGAYLRLIGLDWDENQHLHPDERFLTMVEAALQPVDSLGAYFDTENSTLNPHNQGYGFFVYGTLPIFIVRYAAEWAGQTGYGEVYLVGRVLSAVVDLLVVWLVYLLGARLYGQRVGVLGAAFSAFAVLQIQQSHFFTVDTFTNFFMLLALYLAVEISLRASPRPEGAAGADSASPAAASLWAHPVFWPSIIFGIVLGMAVASKINAAPIAVILPGAVAIYFWRLSPLERQRQAPQLFFYLVVAGLASVVSFRIFQPYAFSGPGFFGFKPNPKWIENLTTLKAQTGGDVDFPPALQWARRPFYFSFQNLTLWGLGLPLGILAWVGFGLMGWRTFRGDWKKHAILWGWTAVYFIWQSIQWNSTMRYQLPVYPTLALMAAWAVLYAVDHAKTRGLRRAALSVGLLVLALTAVWAYAFAQIYPAPHTRVAATRWLFQNMPGAVNLEIQTADGRYNQPLSYPQGMAVAAGQPVELRFTALADGELQGLTLPHAADLLQVDDLTLSLAVSAAFDGANPLALETISGDDLPPADSAEPILSVQLADSVTLVAGQPIYLILALESGFGQFEVCDSVQLGIQTINGESLAQLPLTTGCFNETFLPYPLEFIPTENGILTQIDLNISAQKAASGGDDQTLTAALTTPQGETIALGALNADFAPGADGRGASYYLETLAPVTLVKDQTYSLNLTLHNGAGRIALSGAAPANETSWDDGLPLRMDGYDPYGGIYQGGLNFEMYWDDNADKYERFVSILDSADVLLITSSRQWASTTRVPERHPLTTEYYNRLVGCPPGQTIEWCYNLAQPGMFSGDLGFELVEVFQSNPAIGGLEINDQFAEEAFTVYDHPKVFIFQKSGDYDPEKVRAILGAVDLSKVIRITPKQADSHPGNLLLPTGRLAEQRQGGTWSDYFNPNGLQNRVQIVGVLLWYLSVSLVGLMAYPVIRMALPGLADRGYPLARITGLLLLAALTWLAGSARLPFNRVTIGSVLALMAVLGGVLAYLQRRELARDWRLRRSDIIRVEVLVLALFVIGVLIRWGNPDLWHPWKGGEKPMDFSYFNAVLKSTSFPPFDPWFAGGYINYYYYGFMLVGVLVKFLGIVPAFAYNLILPTLFSLIGAGAFSVTWNIFAGQKSEEDASSKSLLPIVSLAGALLMAVLGNLGILQMFAQGLQKLSAPGGDIYAGGFISRLIWTVTGFFKSVSGTPIPLRMDEWYWNPSRVIAYEHGSPITEFPFFTFLYADLHAHFIALPVALLAVAWAVSVVRSRAWQTTPDGRPALQVGLGFVVGGLAIGALYPINLSDIYTYLPLGAVALIYAIWRANNRPEGRFSQPVWRLLAAAGGVIALLAAALLIYRPYWQWYGQGYSEIRLWDGTHTPMLQYLTHWGLFLFVIVSWMAAETVQWLKATPVSALRKLEPIKNLIWSGLAILMVLLLVLGVNLHPEGLKPESLPLGLGIHIVWLVLPLMLWVLILMLRPQLSESKRMVLFLTGTGLALTLMVELVVVSGDIGRMNTVFKFYLHVWTLFSVSTGAALGWLLLALPRWSFQKRTIWQMGLGFLILSAALYPLLGSLAKIRDRMDADAPHTLDGMTYMAYATYHDEGTAMDLSQDYNAIRWMQDQIEGSPVIVEANSVEYHWGTRYTIYTGLPGVVGWNWHQRQQRTATPHDWVFERVDAVHEFYQTENLDWVVDFLNRYDVGYIVFGQLEQAKYPGPGLEKFGAQNGVLWTEVFRDRETVIYEVVQE